MIKKLHSNNPINIQYQNELENIKINYFREQKVSYNCKLCNKFTIHPIRNLTGLLCTNCICHCNNLRKWGCENVFQSEKIKLKIRQDRKKRTGFEYNSQLESWRISIKKTKKEKWGDENYNNRDKAKETCLKNYGCEYITQSNYWKEELEKSLIKKYNVKNVSQIEEIKLKKIEKQIKNGNKAFKAPNGKTYDSSWEYKFEQYLIEHKIDYIYQSKKSFKWFDIDGKKHNYYPDFCIDGGKEFIEIKGDYFFDENGVYINPYDKTEKGMKNAYLKYKCMIDNGVKIYTSKDLIKLGIEI